MTTSMKAQCSIRPKKNIGSRMCKEAPLKNEFDLIDVKGRGMNEQINVKIQIRDLNKDEVEVLTMYKRVSLAAKLGYRIFKGQAIILGHKTHCELVNKLCRCKFGLQHVNTTKSKA